MYMHTYIHVYIHIRIELRAASTVLQVVATWKQQFCLTAVIAPFLNE